MYKKIISLILCFIIFFQNLALASDNWVKLEKNGKSIDINTSNFAIFDDYISFFAKAKIKNETYLYNFHINCENKTMKIYDLKRITNDKEETIIKDIETTMLNVAPNSLNESMILFIDDTTKYDIRRQDWDKWAGYHLKLMKKIKKEWKPKYIKDKYEYRIFITCELKIDKNGNITNYIIDMPKPENFDFMIKEVKNNPEIIDSIDKAIYKVKKTDKLPKSFKGEYIKVKLAFIYKYNRPDKDTVVSTPDEYGYKNLYICKIKDKTKDFTFDFSKIGKFLGDTFIFILALPFYVLAGVFGILDAVSE